MYFMYPEYVGSQEDTTNPTEQSALFKRLPGMSELSLINPWHAARTLLNQETPEQLQTGKPTLRLPRSIFPEMIPLHLGPHFIMGKAGQIGPMLSQLEYVG